MDGQPHYIKPRRADDRAVIKRANEIAVARGWTLAGILEDMSSGECFAVRRTADRDLYVPIDA